MRRRRARVAPTRAARRPPRRCDGPARERAPRATARAPRGRSPRPRSAVRSPAADRAAPRDDGRGRAGRSRRGRPRRACGHARSHRPPPEDDEGTETPRRAALGAQSSRARGPPPPRWGRRAGAPRHVGAGTRRLSRAPAAALALGARGDASRGRKRKRMRKERTDGRAAPRVRRPRPGPRCSEVLDAMHNARHHAFLTAGGATLGFLSAVGGAASRATPRLRAGRRRCSRGSRRPGAPSV